MTTSCQKCGYSLRPEWRVCPSCAEPVPASCRSCSAKLENGWKVCPICGTAIATPAKVTNDSAMAPAIVKKPDSPAGELNPTRGNAVTTWNLARAVAARVGATQPVQTDDVFRVFDGFRSYVLAPAHYGQRGAKRLVIPHFGIFKISHRQARSGVFPLTGKRYRTPAGYRLGFRLSPSASAARYEKHSSVWTKMAGHVDSSSLSVQRRIALFVSEEVGLDLALVDRVLAETYRQILGVLMNKHHDLIFYKLGRFHSPSGFRASTHALAALAESGGAL